MWHRAAAERAHGRAHEAARNAPSEADMAVAARDPRPPAAVRPMAPSLHFEKHPRGVGARHPSGSAVAAAPARGAADEKGDSMKKQKFKYSDQQALDTCIRQLEGLLEGLRSGTLSLSQGGQKLWLRPGSAVDIELRAEQSGDRETLDIQLGWRRASLHVVSRLAEGAPPKTVRNWQKIQQQYREDSAPRSEGPLHDLDAASAARYQEIYAASRTPSGEGQHRLDEARFTRALAEAGVDAAMQQALYNLALQAEADGRSSLFA